MQRDVLQKVVVKKGIDDVLANTEAAFQSLGKVLAFCIPARPRTWLQVLFMPVTAVLSVAIAAAVILSVVLPSFFTLLIVRTAYVEMESTLFVARQEILLVDTCCRRLLRWMYLIARSLPMTFLLIGWPIVMVVVVNDGASEDVTLTLVLLQLCAVLALQSLGTVRASQSFAAQVRKALTKPIGDTIGESGAAAPATSSAAVTQPRVTFGFNAKAIPNWIALLLLAYEAVQVLCGGEGMGCFECLSCVCVCVCVCLSCVCVFVSPLFCAWRSSRHR